jgi:hypothetical protein
MISISQSPKISLSSSKNALVTLRKGQQSDVASLLDGAGDAALVRGADAGQAAGNNLPTFCHETLQQAHIAIGNGIDFLDAEFANFLTTKEFPSAGTPAGRARWPRARVRGSIRG